MTTQPAQLESTPIEPTLPGPKRATADEAITLLAAFHDLARANLPVDLGVLAGRVGWGVGRVARVLGHLQGRGLADRRRCRLTLSGLAVAVALATERAAAAGRAA